MEIKSKLKNILNKVLSPYCSFRKFFGATNTNLLILIFVLIYLILNTNVSVKKEALKDYELKAMVSDILRFESLNKVWGSYSEYDFLLIKKQIESINFKSESGEIVFDSQLEKFVYKNKKLNKERKKKIILKFKYLKCVYNYCFFK